MSVDALHAALPSPEGTISSACSPNLPNLSVPSPLPASYESEDFVFNVDIAALDETVRVPTVCLSPFAVMVLWPECYALPVPPRSSNSSGRRSSSSSSSRNNTSSSSRGSRSRRQQKADWEEVSPLYSMYRMWKIMESQRSYFFCLLCRESFSQCHCSSPRHLWCMLKSGRISLWISLGVSPPKQVKRQ